MTGFDDVMIKEIVDQRDNYIARLKQRDEIRVERAKTAERIELIEQLLELDGCKQP